MALEDGELMTKDQDLEIVVPILGRAACECDQPAQQQVEDSEERGTAPFRTETRSYERADRTGDRRFSVPFRLSRKRDSLKACLVRGPGRNL
jgi:hypothetical protein